MHNECWSELLACPGWTTVLPEVSHLRFSVQASTNPCWGQSLMEAQLYTPAGVFQHMLDTPGHARVAVVAWENTHPIGHIHVSPCQPYEADPIDDGMLLGLAGIFVAPHRRGQGIARAMAKILGRFLARAVSDPVVLAAEERALSVFAPFVPTVARWQHDRLDTPSLPPVLPAPVQAFWNRVLKRPSSLQTDAKNWVQAWALDRPQHLDRVPASLLGYGGAWARGLRAHGPRVLALAGIEDQVVAMAQCMPTAMEGWHSHPTPLWAGYRVGLLDGRLAHNADSHALDRCFAAIGQVLLASHRYPVCVTTPHQWVDRAQAQVSIPVFARWNAERPAIDRAAPLQRATRASDWNRGRIAQRVGAGCLA